MCIFGYNVDQRNGSSYVNFGKYNAGIKSMETKLTALLNQIKEAF